MLFPFFKLVCLYEITAAAGCLNLPLYTLKLVIARLFPNVNGKAIQDDESRGGKYVA